MIPRALLRRKGVVCSLVGSLPLRPAFQRPTMATTAPAASPRHAMPPAAPTSLVGGVNGRWHERALQGFMAIVLAHWAEHLAQALQVYVLRWPDVEARGVLGLWFPWLIDTEALHYGYALVMLVGLWSLRSGFVGRARAWWMAAFWIQFWHHIEHALLQGQVIVGRNLFDSPVPMSLAQLVIPRMELHMIYNTIVFVPMMVAMFHHFLPTEAERAEMRCTCAIHPDLATG